MKPLESNSKSQYLSVMYAFGFLSEGGEMGALIRAFNWEDTPTGPIDSWPQSLRTTLATLLRSRLPMFLWWGRDLISFYNDAFRPSLGREGKHPGMLGMPAREAWSETWDMISPQITQVLETGESTWNEDVLLRIFRNGVIEDVYWTYTFSPVIDEHSRIGGVLLTGMETTEKVRAQSALKEKADQLELVIDSSDVGIWSTDLRTGKLTCNKRLKIIFGFDEQDEPKSDDFLDRIVKRDRQKVHAAIDCARHPDSRGEYEMEYAIAIPGTDMERELRAKGKMTFDEQGTPIRFSGTAQDITDKNWVLKAARESQRQLFELFEEAPVAIATLESSEDLCFVTANRFYGQLVGRIPSDLVGKPLLTALPEIQGKGFDDLLRGVADSGKPYTAYEVPVDLRRGDGLETVYLNFSYIPRWDADNKVTGILVTATNVTYQVRARQAIADNEALFRSLIEAAPFPIGVYVGDDMQIVHANPAIISIYGKGPDVIGKNYLELLPELLQQGIGEQLYGVYNTGRPFYSNTRRVDIDVNGATVSYYFKYNFIPLFDSVGKVFGILNTGVDVTELELSRQRAEEAETNFRSAAELAELANWSVELPDRLLHLSSRLKEWTGIVEEAVPFAFFLQHIPQEFAQSVASAYEQAFSSNGEMLFDIEHPLQHGKSEHARFVHVRGRLLIDESGIPIRLTGTTQDITTQRAVQWELERQVAERTVALADLNSALQASNRQLEQTIADLKYSNDELSQYAYVTSHDLQEPLRKIRIYSGMLQEKVPLGEEAQFILNKIHKSSARMTRLILDLLGFSKLVGTTGMKQPVDLAQTISSVLEDLELAIAEKRAVLKMEFLPVVTGIEFQLRQLFHNLIGNALKFSDPQRIPVIRLSARQLSLDEVATFIPSAEKRVYYEISITDNGIGFERQYYAHIFELFKQLHPRDVYSGSGIGLATCRRIVTNHLGHIYATSILGEGSTFFVLLPA